MKVQQKELIRSVAGEFLCTFIFLFSVFCVLVNSSRVADPILAGTIAPGVVVAFVAVAIIFAFGDVSGAHFNPAVTMGFLITRKIGLFKGSLYIGVQLVAAIMATLVIFAVFPDSTPGLPTIAQIIPVAVPDTTPIAQALLMEFFLTFLLVYIIFATAVDSPALPTPTRPPVPRPKAEDRPAKEITGDLPPAIGSPSPAPKDLDLEAAHLASSSKSPMLPTLPEGAQVYLVPSDSKNSLCALAIGLTLGFLVYLGGSSSGGAFNPARVFGPALMTGNWNSHWVYWTGDLLGGATAALIHTFIFARTGALLSVPPAT